MSAMHAWKRATKPCCRSVALVARAALVVKQVPSYGLLSVRAEQALASGRRTVFGFSYPLR